MRMEHNYEYENAMGLSAEALKSMDYLDLAARFGQMARLNKELLRKQGVIQPFGDRYIGADALKNHIRAWREKRYGPGHGWDEIEQVLTVIDEHPIEAFLRRGKWEKTDSGKEYCSNCGHFIHLYEAARRYCPNCGACMDKTIQHPTAHEWKR